MEHRPTSHNTPGNNDLTTRAYDSSSPYEKHKDFSKFWHQFVDSGQLANLTSSELRVYLVLLRYADYTSFKCHVSRKTISNMSGVSYSSISAITKSLKGKGLIDKTTCRISTSWRRTEYYIPKDIYPAEVAENPEQGVVQNHEQGAAENLGQGVVGNLGYINKDSRTETTKTETNQINKENNDLFSCIKCENKNTLLINLGKAFSTSYLDCWGDKMPIWVGIRNAVADYHLGREQRSIPCHYTGCVSLVLEKVNALKNTAVQHHLPYFKKSLHELLEDETDATAQNKEYRAINRTNSSGDWTDARTIANNLERQNEST